MFKRERMQIKIRLSNRPRFYKRIRRWRTGLDAMNERSRRGTGIPLAGERLGRLEPTPPSPLAQICARVDYVNGLQENLKGQEAASEEVRAEFQKLLEQCRTALRDRAEEND